jgi:hypothetical protein
LARSPGFWRGKQLRAQGWERIDLGAIVQHPAFMVMEKSAVIVVHVQVRDEANLTQV